MRNRQYVKPGDRVRVIAPYSEVMCHFGLAGTPVEIELIQNGDYFSAQVWKDKKPFSGTITTGEAGFYRDDDGYYTYEVDPDNLGDSNPRQVMADIRQMLSDAMGTEGVRTITNLGLNF